MYNSGPPRTVDIQLNIVSGHAQTSVDFCTCIFIAKIIFEKKNNERLIRVRMVLHITIIRFPT